MWLFPIIAPNLNS